MKEIIEQTSVLMVLIGAFTFLAMGLSIVNSIESKESDKTENIMFIIMLLGITSFIFGFFGLFISIFLL